MGDYLVDVVYNDMVDYFDSKEEMKEAPPHIVVTDKDDLVTYADFVTHPFDRNYVLYHKDGLYEFFLCNLGLEVLPP